jgi:predicted molibdopterin-dependent oxidoreductase YjgC
MAFLGISNPLLGLGDLERRSLSLRSVAPEPCLKISSKRADQLALSEGSVASLSTAAGSAEFKVVIDPDMPDDLVIIPQMCGGAAMVGLMEWRVNPVTKSPSFDETQVVIKKVIRP